MKTETKKFLTIIAVIGMVGLIGCGKGSPMSPTMSGSKITFIYFKLNSIDTEFRTGAAVVSYSSQEFEPSGTIDVSSDNWVSYNRIIPPQFMYTSNGQITIYVADVDSLMKFRMVGFSN
jgi:hypothetical protein